MRSLRLAWVGLLTVGLLTLGLVTPLVMSSVSAQESRLAAIPDDWEIVTADQGPLDTWQLFAADSLFPDGGNDADQLKDYAGEGVSARSDQQEALLLLVVDAPDAEAANIYLSRGLRSAEAQESATCMWDAPDLVEHRCTVTNDRPAEFLGWVSGNTTVLLTAFNMDIAEVQGLVTEQLGLVTPTAAFDPAIDGGPSVGNQVLNNGARLLVAAGFTFIVVTFMRNRRSAG